MLNTLTFNIKLYEQSKRLDERFIRCAEKTEKMYLRSTTIKKR